MKMQKRIIKTRRKRKGDSNDNKKPR